MDIRFYNTLTHRTEKFEPIAPPEVLMYNCGPTVYDFAHIGNFRAFVFADVLRRFLELAGHNVRQVMNLTDVGHMTDDAIADGGGQDKMQVAAQRLKEAKKAGQAHASAIANPDDPYQVAQFYIDAFLEDGKKLGLKIAHEYDADANKSHMPRATQHVGKMMKIILKLVENGHAYVGADKAVYFAVESFPDYGKLSGNTLDKLRTGAGGRVSDHNQSNKRHPADFLLWKPDSSHLMKWESPWGAGYPGWHIECSAMALEVLSRLAGRDIETIDIHTGGEDNIFPHHECEIAQTCGATGKPLFARFWMHTRFLLVEGEKMSKSKGNFFTVRDVLAGKATGRPVDAAVLRYELLKAHYRSNMNFTAQGLQDSASAVQKLRDVAAKAGINASAPAPRVEIAIDRDHGVVRDFTAALADDLNVSAAMAHVFDFVSSSASRPAAETAAVLYAVDSVLGVLAPTNQASSVSGGEGGGDEAAEKCAALDAARKSKDFATADRLRKELQDAGYEVMTTKAGTTARKRLA